LKILDEALLQSDWYLMHLNLRATSLVQGVARSRSHQSVRESRQIVCDLREGSKPFDGLWNKSKKKSRELQRPRREECLNQILVFGGD